MKQKMKKTVVGVLAAGMVLSLGATGVFAAGSGYGRNFVDTDKDGICDYVGSGCRYIDSNNDGYFDNYCKRGFSQTGYGRNFIDADGNGVCDNYGTGQGSGFCGGRNK